jgi:hypothetical protein
MKIAVYKQIDTKIVDTEIVVPAQYDDDGNIISDERIETIRKEVPVMGMVYRDATAEEVSEMEATKPIDSDSRTSELTIEDRVAILEEQVAELR